MITKIKNYLLILTTTLMMSFPMLVPAAVSAATDTPKDCNNAAQSGVAQGANGALDPSGNNQIDCSKDNGAGTGDNITNLAKQAVNLFSIVVGAVAVIMIIYGGFRYITSGGDSGNVGNAKNTLIYAIVGLIIVALAQIIVQFVLTQSATVTSGE